MRKIERQLQDTDGVLYVHYGRCASHSRTCPWASLDVTLESEFDLQDPDGAHLLTDLPSQRVYKLSDDRALEQEWLVRIPLKRDPDRATEVWLTGTLGMERAALGALPVRAIQDALAER